MSANGESGARGGRYLADEGAPAVAHDGLGSLIVNAP